MADYSGKGFDPQQPLGGGTASPIPGKEMGAGVLTVHTWISAGGPAPPAVEKWDGAKWVTDTSATRLAPPRPLLTTSATSNPPPARAKSGGS